MNFAILLIILVLLKSCTLAFKSEKKSYGGGNIFNIFCKSVNANDRCKILQEMAIFPMKQGTINDGIGASPPPASTAARSFFLFENPVLNKFCGYILFHIQIS
jgi:hypothetical protein